MSKKIPTESATPILPSRFGLIAAEGDFPLLITEAAVSNKIEVIVFALKGFANEKIEDIATKVHWLELGQLGTAIKLMHSEGIAHLSMAGRVPHNSIFQYRHFDMRAVKLLAKAINKRADGLLNAVTKEFEAEGIQIMDSSLFVKQLMPKSGLITPSRELTENEKAQIEFGFPIAKTIAGQDIGQTVIVNDTTVVAVEGMEGTDECILRAGKLAGPGCVIIKVSKPRQDMRFDIPIIGPGTLKSMKQAGATALAISANKSLVFHKERLIEMAKESDICLIAWPDNNT